jgi:hypothetical protein
MRRDLTDLIFGEEKISPMRETILELEDVTILLTRDGCDRTGLEYIENTSCDTPLDILCHTKE